MTIEQHLKGLETRTTDLESSVRALENRLASFEMVMEQMIVALNNHETRLPEEKRIITVN